MYIHTSCKYCKIRTICIIDMRYNENKCYSE